MTAAEQPQARPGAPVRAWRSFRRWRRGRPFWGGLVTILSGFLYYFSVHLNPTKFLTVNFGQNGFLAWLIPLMLVVCGLLAWLSPAQRIFYGIVAAATAVYGLIAVNLGGFFLGMLVGMVGGSLIASWSPAKPKGVPASEPGPDGEPEDATTEPDGVPADGDTAVFPRITDEPGDPRPAGYGDYRPGGSGDVEDAAGQPTRLRSGPLTDELPAADQGPRHAAETPVPRQWRHRGRGATLALIPLMAVALGLLIVPRSSDAYADTTPCAPTASATSKPATRPSTPAASGSSAPATAPSSAAPSASPAGTSGGGGVLQDIVDGVKKLFGLGPTASPSATPGSPRPTASSVKPAAKAVSPSTKTSTPARKKTTGCTPSASTSPKPANATIQAVPAGQPPVAGDPAVLTTDTLTMNGLSYDGVFDLPTKDGSTVQVLKFSMDSADQTPFQLQVPAGNGHVVQTSTKLVISGHVEFYCTRFVGWLLDLVKLTFTPDAPPPLTLPTMTFNRAEIQLVYVHADKLVAADFGNKTAS